MSQLQVFSFPPSGRAATVSLSLLLLFSPLLPAQNQPPPVSSGGGVPAASKSTTGSSAASALKANANEVSFDLAVRTKHNKPVIDLQPSQLAVTDGGQAVQLSSLHLVDNSSGSQHLAVFVFDRLDRGVTKTARKMAANLIGAIPAHGYSIAVLQVDGRLRLLQPFTDDRKLIEAAAGKAVSASLQPRLTSLTPAEKSLIATVHGDALVAERAQDKLLLTAMEQSQQILEDRRSYPSLAALQALVESDRLLTGRKFIFYFSAGIDANSDVRDILKSIVAQANRAGVTIWVLDTTRMNEGMNSAQQASLASSIPAWALPAAAPAPSAAAAGSAQLAEDMALLRLPTSPAMPSAIWPAIKARSPLWLSAQAEHISVLLEATSISCSGCGRTLAVGMRFRGRHPSKITMASFVPSSFTRCAKMSSFAPAQATLPFRSMKKPEFALLKCRC